VSPTVLTEKSCEVTTAVEVSVLVAWIRLVCNDATDVISVDVFTAIAETISVDVEATESCNVVPDDGSIVVTSVEMCRVDDKA